MVPLGSVRKGHDLRSASSILEMQILKVTQASYPFLDRGGPAVKVNGIANGLAERGHQVTVLTADLGFTKPGVPQGPSVRRDPLGWRIEQGNVESIYLQTWVRYRALTANPAVITFCKRRLSTFDVVHVYGLYDLLGPVIAFFCRRRGLPYLVEPMGMLRPIVRSLWLKRFYHQLLGNDLVSGSCLLIATSQQERQELIEEGVPREKVFVRRNGIALPCQFPDRGSFRRKLGIAADAKVVLFLGRLVSKKSPDLLLRAFAGCGAADPYSVLVLAGPDEGDGYRRRLELLVAKLGLAGRVLFPGPLYEQDKWSAYRDADIFVLPSQNENFGNTAAEAIACGTPVVVTDCCGIAPLVDGTAGIVVSHSEESIGTALMSLLQDDSLRRLLKSKCDEVVSRLSWEEPIATMEALYRNLVAKGNPAG